MPKGSCRAILFGMAMMLLAAAGFSQPALCAEKEEFTIDIAPPVVRFDSTSLWLTIHTDLPYRSVQKDMPIILSLAGGENTISAQTVSEDAKGNLVVRFALQEVQNFLNPEIGRENTFVLECFTVSGDTLIGKKEVRVGKGGRE